MLSKKMSIINCFEDGRFSNETRIMISKNMYATLKTLLGFRMLIFSSRLTGFLFRSINNNRSIKF